MTADKTTMRDGELRASLEGGPTAPDPAFRVRVLQRICERAARRAMIRRAALWIAASIGIGFVAQALTPPASGVPSLEVIAMTVSIGATALMLAALTATSRAAQRIHRAFTGKPIA